MTSRGEFEVGENLVELGLTTGGTFQLNRHSMHTMGSEPFLRSQLFT